MANDPHVLAREMFVDVPAWNGKTFRVVSSPIKLSRTPHDIRKGADSPGGHTRELLRSVLNLSDADIDADLAAGVIGGGER
jgi:crotonobetainyl-CoA:carnitine CoA-transferase CaiB-like acyl-CoA transferase